MPRSFVRVVLMSVLGGWGTFAQSSTSRTVDPRDLAVVVASSWIPCQQTTLALVDRSKIGLNGPVQIGWRTVQPTASTSNSKCPMREPVNQKRVSQSMAQLQAKIDRAIAQKRMVRVEANGNIAGTSARMPADKVISQGAGLSSLMVGGSANEFLAEAPADALPH